MKDNIEELSEYGKSKRRSLITGIGAIAAASLLPLPKVFAADGKSSAYPMINLQDDLIIPQLGAGTWTLTGDVATNCVKTAIETGYRLIDTAQAYGNEAAVYQGVVASKVPRNSIFITTKISPDNMRNGTVRESIQDSLQALGGDYIDLLLIHWPVNDKVEETWKIMEEFVKQNKVRAIGLSNFNPHHIDELLTYATIKPVVNQIELHPYMSQQEVVGQTFNQDIRVEAWSPLGSGQNGVLQDKVIGKIANKYKKSIAQIILRWHIQRGVITIPRSSNPEHIQENMNIFDFTLSPVDMSIINGLNKNERWNPKNDPDSFPW
ncbi:MAG: aldo/keto reductase [Vibrio sp.]